MSLSGLRCSESSTLAGLALLALALAACGGGPRDDAGTIRALIDRGSYGDALDRGRQRLQRVETETGADSPQTAEAIDLVVEALWRSGQAREPETLALAQRALQLKEAALGPSDPALVATLTQLGTVLRRAGDAEAAKTALDRAMRILAGSGGPDVASAGPIETQLGIMDLSRGDHAAAQARLERAVSILERERGERAVDLIDPLRALGVLHRRMGRYDEAQPVYRRAMELEAMHFAEDSPERARTLNSYAALLQNTGDYAGARARFEQALAVRRNTLEAGHLDIGVSLNNLAIVLGNIGDHTSAVGYYAEARAILEAQLGEEHPHVALALNNHANSLRELGEHERARELFDRALAIRERTLEPDHPDLAQSLTNLAILHTDTGDSESARSLYEKALPIWKSALGPEHLEVAECLSGYAEVLATLGDLPRARDVFAEALEIRENAGGVDHPLVAETLVRAARAAMDSGAGDRALSMALRAHAIRREHVRVTSRTLAEREALGYGDSRTAALDLALHLVTRDGGSREAVSAVWDAVIRSRALVLDEIAVRNRDFGAATNPEIARGVAQLKLARKRLAELWVQGADDDPAAYRTSLDRAREDKERAEAALARTSLDYRRRREHARTGFDEVRDALPANGALVAYVRLEDPHGTGRYAAFVLADPQATPVAVALGAADEVDATVAAWRDGIVRGGEVRGRALRQAEQRYRDAAAPLRERIWDPVRERLAGASTVFVVADGALNLVSLASLPIANERYLVDDDLALRHLVTERDLLPRDDPEPAELGLLAVGGPAYDDRGRTASPTTAALRSAGSACDAFQSMVFPPLAEAEREAREIATTWSSIRRQGKPAGSARVLTGAEATESAFKTLAPRSRVVHVATHGYFLGGACASVTEAADTVAGESPLLLSGLALAGANLRLDAKPGGEDGVLTGEEVATLDLSRTEWVVLSACDTGLGPIRRGEDVFGLRRAFQSAGSRKIVMSLWQVDDLAGRQWMGAFYDAAFARSPAPLSPERTASRAVLEGRRRRGESTHPFFWAGFLAFGT